MENTEIKMDEFYNDAIREVVGGGISENKRSVYHFKAENEYGDTEKPLELYKGFIDQGKIN